MASVASAGYFVLAKMRLVAEAAEKSFRVGAGATGVSASLSMALIGVGHLVGLAVGIAMIVGLLIARVWLLPWLTAEAGVPAGAEVDAVVADVFRNKVRFIGAGTIGVAAIWTLLKILGPILKGIKDSLAASRKRVSLAISASRTGARHREQVMTGAKRMRATRKSRWRPKSSDPTVPSMCQATAPSAATPALVSRGIRDNGVRPSTAWRRRANRTGSTFGARPSRSAPSEPCRA